MVGIISTMTVESFARRMRAHSDNVTALTYSRDCYNLDSVFPYNNQVKLSKFFLVIDSRVLRVISTVSRVSGDVSITTTAVTQQAKQKHACVLFFFPAASRRRVIDYVIKPFCVCVCVCLHLFFSNSRAFRFANELFLVWRGLLDI